MTYSGFVGSEAVTWPAKTQNATREAAAVRIGQALVDQGNYAPRYRRTSI